MSWIAMAHWLVAVSLLLVFSATYGSIIPRGYRLDLHPYPGDGVFKGKVRIDFISTSNQSVNSLTLDVHSTLNVVDREVKIIRVANLDSSEEDDEVSMEETTLTVTKLEKRKDLHTFQITTKQNFKKDITYQVEILFDGSLGSDPSSPFYQSTYANSKHSTQKKWFIAMNLPRAGGARYVFPCFEKSELKTWIELSVAHKGDVHVLTTMPLVDTTNVTSEGVWVRDHFSRSPPMSVNSLAMFQSDFKHPSIGENNGAKIGIWGKEDLLRSLYTTQKLLPSVLDSLELYLSRPYPLPELNLVALPGYADDKPIDAWGLQMFRELDLSKKRDDFWIVHLLAKYVSLQWTSHLTTPIFSSSLTTAISKFLADKIAWQLEKPVFDSFVKDMYGMYIEFEKPDLKEIKSQMEALNTTKIQFVLEMLEHVFGPQSFKQSIQYFMSSKEYHTYTEADFWNKLTEGAYNEGILKKGEDPANIEDIVRPWLQADRFPVVTFRRNYKNTTVQIMQEPFVLNDDEDDVSTPAIVTKSYSWWIPNIVVSQNNLTVSTTNITWLRPISSQEVDFKQYNFTNNQFLLYNPGSIGPFIVNYDLKNWEMIAQHSKRFPVNVRLQLLHDSLSLALSGRLCYVYAFNVSKLIEQESEPAVWKTYLGLATRLRSKFQGTPVAPKYDLYLKKMLKSVNAALEQPERGESSWKSQFRAENKRLLCETGHTTCLMEAREMQSRTNTSNPDEDKLFLENYLCILLGYGTLDEWEFGLHRIMYYPKNKSQTERLFIFRSLASCPKNETKFVRMLNLTLMSEDRKFSEEDMLTMLTVMSTVSLGHETMFKFLVKNFEYLSTKLEKNVWEYFVKTSFSHFRTEDGLNKATEFYQKNKRHFASVDDIVKNGLEKVKIQVGWVKKHLTPLDSWLTNALQEPWRPHEFNFRDVPSFVAG
ncbi:endoplasmic reticulum aminopeptidase 2-like [Daktulosphaira vitifoliae]|uniref:endoplasmic reticulum aminopeptidase 2-like n=1 Tax=Daktulosphaira vitifoliae TaxID=58002 RepID=UPI0021AA5E9C|nr:endoplasmic reticulum aminopeptidase 2-like [Daktulosphaira vitifoliae]